MPVDADDITVTELDADRFRVEVRSGARTTTHEVVVAAGYPALLGCAAVAPAELVAASFAFLLEREPSTSILRRFSLEQIADYFPEYPAEIASYLD